MPICCKERRIITCDSLRGISHIEVFGFLLSETSCTHECAETVVHLSQLWDWEWSDYCGYRYFKITSPESHAAIAFELIEGDTVLDVYMYDRDGSRVFHQEYKLEDLDFMELER